HYFSLHWSSKSKARILSLLANDLDEHALLAASIEFAVENLLPGTEIEFAVGDRHDNFASHHLAFDVGIGIVFAGVVVAVLFGGRVRHEAFEEVVVVLQETGLVIVDV